MQSFAETQSGLLFFTDGLSPSVLKWDGLKPQAEPVGVVAPATKLTLSVSGIGRIVGKYQAFSRYVDGLGNFGRLSPISDELDGFSSTGTVTGASNDTPLTITSAGHGLNSSVLVKITGVGGNTAANGIFNITVTGADTFQLLDSNSQPISGNGNYTGGGTWKAGSSTITYSNVPVTSDPKVVKRQLLRNTDGQKITWYIDIETTNLSSTAFSSTRQDSELRLQASQSTSDPITLLDPSLDYGLPPNYKAYLAHHLDRMFLGGEYPYGFGNIKVTLGSSTVTGVDTSWTKGLEKRFLHVQGAHKTYEIDTVDPNAQTLTLKEAYADSSDNFAVYAVRSAPAERRTIYFSVAGKPEAWNPFNGFTLQEDGDEITGLMPKGSWLYILERRHVYRLTFQDNPTRDGGVYLAADRGCLNHRCFVTVDDTAYMLDEQGCHAFATGNETRPISTPIQDVFRKNPSGLFRVNWNARDRFHAVHHQHQETVRWFICLAGDEYPRHALAYNYRLGRWWVEEWPFSISGSVAGRHKGVPQTYLGGGGGKWFGFWEGALDGADPALGTVRGTITSAGLQSLTDTLADFDATYLGKAVVLVDGTGKGQLRIITAVTGTGLTLKEPWLILPDTTTAYQIGGVVWNYRTAWVRYIESEDNMERRLEVLFQPVVKPAAMDLKIRHNFAPLPTVWQSALSSIQGMGVKTTKGGAELTVDLTKANGFAQKRFPGHRDIYLEGKRFLQVECGGVTNQDRQALFQIIYEGAAGQSTGQEQR